MDFPLRFLFIGFIFRLFSQIHCKVYSSFSRGADEVTDHYLGIIFPLKAQSFWPLWLKWKKSHKTYFPLRLFKAVPVIGWTEGGEWGWGLGVCLGGRFGWNWHHSHQHKQGEQAARTMFHPVNIEHQQISLYLQQAGECWVAHMSLPPLNYNTSMP